jgi:hypothetical protein
LYLLFLINIFFALRRAFILISKQK